MNGFAAVFRQSLISIIRSGTFRVLLAVFIVICIAASVITGVLLGGEDWLSNPLARPLLELISGLLLYFLPFTIIIAMIWSFAGIPLTKEKTEGCIESLLASPVSAEALWLGKCISVFLPAYCAALAGTACVICVINIFIFAPAAGLWIVPENAVLIGLVINPLLLFAILSLVILTALTASPDIAMALSFLAGFLLMIGIPLGLALKVLDSLSRSFAFGYFVVTLLLSLAVLISRRLLVKERIILSSSGE